MEFIKMKGPGGKGHAEMAITQQRTVDDRTSLEEMENNDWYSNAQTINVLLT